MIAQVFRRNAVTFVLSLGVLFMTCLCVEQSHTIDSQRTLIRSLFQDSLELNAIKVKHIQDLMRR